jgi:ATP phosphoribosyltransferase
MDTIKIAVQKSGRLHEGSLQLLKDCGIVIDNGSDQLKASAHNFPIDILYLRNSDIPQYLEDGVADIAILGENILAEKQKNVKTLMGLDFSRCRISLAIPKDDIYSGLSYFEGKKIATSYPAILKRFLASEQLHAEIHEISGSVEIAPNIGLADAIFDIVSSGSTLFKNGLKEVHKVFQSQAVLASSCKLDPQKEQLLDRLMFRMKAVLKARDTKYILMNVPNDKIEAVSALLPVLKSPTILPLAMDGWSSLHSVINENQFWEVIDQLKEAGAEGILVVPVEKMVI